MLTRQVRSLLSEVLIMPTLFWLALLLGYLAGVSGAILVLPAPLLQPMYGPLAVTTALVVGVAGFLWRSRHRQRRAEALEPGTTTPDDPARDDQATTHASAAGPLWRRVAANARRALRSDRPEGSWPLLVRLEPPGVLGPSELRLALDEGRLDALLQPLTNLAVPEAAVQHAVARLRTAEGTPLPPARYRSTAARCGLLGLIDRLLIRECAGALRRAASEGRELSVVCEIATESLNDSGFVGELSHLVVEAPRLARRLVLALDRTRLDQLAKRTLGRFRTLGGRVCLKRIGPPPPDVAALAEQGFDLVMLEARRFTQPPAAGQEVEPALLEIQRRLAAAGLELLVARSEPEPPARAILVDPSPGVVGRAALMAEARPSAA
jgi:EAL domain-containing protein (putative c-di-GMP-specific phosphodiesterase class I)